ncbi:MAG: DUF4342 domain-containing protein [Lentisphaerota bacterium]
MTAKKSRKSAGAKSRIENFKVQGDEVLKKVKAVIKEGNVRKITIKDKQGNTLAVFPLTVGIVGAVFAPILAAIGAIAALATESVISIERK